MLQTDAPTEFVTESLRYCNSLNQYDRTCLVQYTDFADMVANNYANGKSFESLLLSKDVLDRYEKNLGQTECIFLSAQMRYEFENTEWWETLTDDQKRLSRLLLDEWPSSAPKSNYREAGAMIVAKYGEAIAYLFGSDIAESYAISFNFDPVGILLAFWQKSTKQSLIYTNYKVPYKTRLVLTAKAYSNSVGPFSKNQLDRMIAQLASDLARIFSGGLQIGRPFHIFRGIKANDYVLGAGAKFQSCSYDLDNAINYWDSFDEEDISCCILNIRLTPGVQTFTFSETLRIPKFDEHEVVIPPNANLVVTGRSQVLVQNKMAEVVNLDWLPNY